MTHYLMSDKLVLQHVLYTADAIIDGHRRALSTLLKAAMTRLKTRLSYVTTYNKEHFQGYSFTNIEQS